MALEIIDEEHSRVHNGEMFNYSDSNSVAAGASINHALIVDGKECHLRVSFSAAQAGTISLIEKPDRIYSGLTTTTIYNRRRNSPNRPTVKMQDQPSYSGGTTVWIKSLGAPTTGNTTSPFNLENVPRSAYEWILAPNTTYIIRVTNDDNSTSVISLHLNWYEVQV